MARYIDADKIHEFVDTKVAEGKDGWSKGVPYEWAYALTVIDHAPTADVAPKSEVDYARQCGYESGIRTGSVKVFEEIDELIKDYANNHLDAAELVVILYLLKQKYTEGET